MCLFFFSGIQIFSLLLILSFFIVMYFVVFPFMFFMLVRYLVSWIHGFIVFSKIWNIISHFFFKYFFFSCLLSFGNFNYTFIMPLGIVLQLTDVFSFFKIFFSLCFLWIVSVAIYSCSLTFSSRCLICC